MIDMKFVGMASVLGAMQRMRQSVPRASILGMKAATEFLRGYITSKKLSGQILKVGRVAKRRAGMRYGQHLRSSIKSGQYLVGGGVVGIVYSELIYSRIHELGGDIYPVNAPYLHFYHGGHWVKTQHVHIPARPYMYPSLMESANRINQILGEKFVATVITEGTKLSGVKYG